MYCAPSDILGTACGQHVAPVWPSSYHSVSFPSNGKGPGKHWPTSQCAWVPAYIVHGLLENVALENKCPSDKLGKGGKARKDGLSPQEQELHQQMLQKLALHLAAQPESQQEPLQEKLAPLTQDPCAEQQKERPQASSPLRLADVLQEPAKGMETNQPSESCKGNKEIKSTKEAKGKIISPQDQEFQQEMLRKLALHLASQDHMREASPESISGHKETGQVREALNSPEVFPDTPSSFGDDNCQNYFIGDEEGGHGEEESVQCWQACSQCVWVPMHVAYGLLEGIVPGHENPGGKGDNKGSKQGQHVLVSQEQEFHQEMLQKLALHLAAQPVSLQQEQVSTLQRSQELVPHARSKISWADVTDDVAELPPASRAVEKVKRSCDSVVKTKETKVKCPKPNKAEEEKAEMLRKLALHLAAQPELEDQPEEATLATISEANALGQDKSRCDHLIAELDGPRAKEITEWVLPSSRALSLTDGGSRLVQKVIDLASGKEREQLLEVLQSDVEELYTSPHANHVIAKLVEIMPAERLASIGEAMRGKATTMARHQFGSRILERLIEHCGEDLIGFLLDELLEDFEPLARHQFGNFVVARFLEHTTSNRKHIAVQKLLPCVLQHATHKTACNSVQRLLEHSDLACQAAIADAFLAGSGEESLEAIAATRYGSFVIQHLVHRFHPRIDAVQARVKAAHSQLKASGFSQRKIVQFLGEAFFRE